MKTKLTKAETDELLPHIRQVLETGKLWKDENLHHPAGAIIEAMLGIEGVQRKATEESYVGFSSNGWQYNWWQQFTYQGKDYTLNGSGYYGGHAFYVAD